MGLQFANFARSRLTANMLSSDTTLTVQNGGVFPSIGDYYLVIGNEILKCTARSTNTLTVSRGKQGTTAAAHTLGDLVTRSITRDDIAACQVQVGPFANRPAVGVAGRMYFANDSLLKSYDDGTKWQSRIFGQLITEYDDSAFSWLNQGSATLDTSKGYGHLSVPGSSSINIRARLMTAPTPPYTIQAFLGWTQINSNYQNCGLCWRSSDGKISALAATELQKFFVLKYNNENSFNSGYAINVPNVYGAANATVGTWLSLVDDGTTRWFEISVDGAYWYILHSVGRTDFHTPTQVGWHADTEHGFPMFVNCYSWLRL